MNRKILRFTASWCGPCKMLAKNIDVLVLPVPVEVVDIDDQFDLATQYNIRGVPTLVMVEDGKEVGRLVGMKTIPELEKWVNSFS